MSITNWPVGTRLRRWPRRYVAAMAATVLLAGPITGCSSAAPSTDTTPTAVSIVASTNVYGSIAAMIGGERVTVTSLIDSPEQDPHSYEATTRDQLTLSKASLVIENGGGYDDFIDTMMRADSNADVAVLNVVTISGKTADADGELNEHVWFDLDTMGALADHLADSLATIDPAGADDYRDRAAAFHADLNGIAADIAAVATAHAGTAVAITEPLPVYLLATAGLVNKTPDEFSEALEGESDPSPLDMHEMVELLSQHRVAALVYNEQTSGPATERLLEAAEEGGVPVVPVSETMPTDTDYIEWMRSTVESLATALTDAAPDTAAIER